MNKIFSGFIIGALAANGMAFEAGVSVVPAGNLPTAPTPLAFAAASGAAFAAPSPLSIEFALEPVVAARISPAPFAATRAGAKESALSPAQAAASGLVALTKDVPDGGREFDGKGTALSLGEDPVPKDLSGKPAENPIGARLLGVMDARSGFDGAIIAQSGEKYRYSVRHPGTVLEADSDAHSRTYEESMVKYFSPGVPVEFELIPDGLTKQLVATRIRVLGVTAPTRQRFGRSGVWGK